MTISFTLRINHPSLEDEIIHEDTLTGPSLSKILKKFDLPSKAVCDLKNHGMTAWRDSQGATMTLSMRKEAVH